VEECGSQRKTEMDDKLASRATAGWLKCASSAGKSATLSPAEHAKRLTSRINN